MEQCIIFVDVLVLSPKDSHLAPSWFVSMQALTLRNGVVLRVPPLDLAKLALYRKDVIICGRPVVPGASLFAVVC